MPEWSILIETKKPWSVRAKTVTVPDSSSGGRGKAAWIARFGMNAELQPSERVMGVVSGCDIDLTAKVRMIADPRVERDQYAEECLHRVRSVASRTSNWTLCGKEINANWGSVADVEYADPCLKCVRLGEI